jgi:hypothetical protein
LLSFHHIYPERECYIRNEDGQRIATDMIRWRFHDLQENVVYVTRKDHDWIENNVVPPPFPSVEEMEKAISVSIAYRRRGHYRLLTKREAVEYMLPFGITLLNNPPRKKEEFSKFLRVSAPSRTIAEATGTRFQTAGWG